MAANKLNGKVEQVSWSPPYLSFTIVRHGRTVLSSSRGDLHDWKVNLESLEATYTEGGYRQLRPNAPRLDVKFLSERLLATVQQGPGSDSELVLNKTFVWKDKNHVTIQPSKLIPTEGFRETIEGRRRRLRTELTRRMSELGWRLEKSRGQIMLFGRMQ
jgi:hypothetical protein